jgi:hypothetical protein
MLMRADSMVILEAGGRWPSWLGEPADAATHTSVVAQQPGETLGAFKRRANRRIRSLERPLTATLVCGPKTGIGQQALRRSLAEALIQTMNGFGRGHVVLVADGGHMTRRQVVSLATELSHRLDPQSMVSLRFRALPPEQQVAFQTALAS